MLNEILDATQGMSVEDIVDNNYPLDVGVYFLIDDNFDIASAKAMRVEKNKKTNTYTFTFAGNVAANEKEELLKKFCCYDFYSLHTNANKSLDVISVNGSGLKLFRGNNDLSVLFKLEKPITSGNVVSAYSKLLKMDNLNIFSEEEMKEYDIIPYSDEETLSRAEKFSAIIDDAIVRTKEIMGIKDDSNKKPKGYVKVFLDRDISEYEQRLRMYWYLIGFPTSDICVKNGQKYTKPPVGFTLNKAKISLSAKGTRFENKVHHVTLKEAIDLLIKFNMLTIINEKQRTEAIKAQQKGWKPVELTAKIDNVKKEQINRHFLYGIKGTGGFNINDFLEEEQTPEMNEYGYQKVEKLLNGGTFYWVGENLVTVIVKKLFDAYITNDGWIINSKSFDCFNKSLFETYTPELKRYIYEGEYPTNFCAAIKNIIKLKMTKVEEVYLAKELLNLYLNIRKNIIKEEVNVSYFEKLKSLKDNFNGENPLSFETEEEFYYACGQTYNYAVSKAGGKKNMFLFNVIMTAKTPEAVRKSVKDIITRYNHAIDSNNRFFKAVVAAIMSYEPKEKILSDSSQNVLWAGCLEKCVYYTKKKENEEE